MRRRDFLTFAGIAALAWQRAARAQTTGVPVIGFLTAASGAAYASRIAAFRMGLAEGDFVEGKTVTIEFRHADGRNELMRALADELVRRSVTVLFAAGTTAALACKAATTTIPVVFSSGANPVGLGLVASLARPGGNLTGTTRFGDELGGKKLQLLHELVPNGKVFALLANPTNPELAETVTKDAVTAAQRLGLELRVLSASTEQEMGEAFAKMVQNGVAGVMISPDSFLTSQTARLALLAARHGIPAIGPSREFVLAGGLLSYGGDLEDGYRIAGNLTARVLKGAKPADLAVQQSTRLGMALNLKAAKSLGIAVPTLLLAQADEVIE